MTLILCFLICNNAVVENKCGPPPSLPIQILFKFEETVLAYY